MLIESNLAFGTLHICREIRIVCAQENADEYIHDLAMDAAEYIEELEARLDIVEMLRQLLKASRDKQLPPPQWVVSIQSKVEDYLNEL